MISEKYQWSLKSIFIFKKNLYVACYEGIYIFSKKTNLLLGKWIPQLKSKGGWSFSQWARRVWSRRGHIQTCFSLPVKKETKIRPHSEEDLDKASCFGKYLFGGYKQIPGVFLIQKEDDCFCIYAFDLSSLIIQSKVCSYIILSWYPSCFLCSSYQNLLFHAYLIVSSHTILWAP